jgi:hypothetical protein
LNSCRLKDCDYVCDEEEEDDDESDEDDYGSDNNLNVKKRLIVRFPWHDKFRVKVAINEVIDVWEGNESEVGWLAFKLQNLHSSPVIRMIKSRRISCVGHVTCMERREVHMKFCYELKGRDHMEDLGKDRRIILKWILKE